MRKPLTEYLQVLSGVITTVTGFIAARRDNGKTITNLL